MTSLKRLFGKKHKRIYSDYEEQQFMRKALPLLVNEKALKENSKPKKIGLDAPNSLFLTALE